MCRKLCIAIQHDDVINIIFQIAYFYFKSVFENISKEKIPQNWNEQLIHYFPYRQIHPGLRFFAN